jgi:hypothetical protein
MRTFGTKIAFRTRVPCETELRDCEHDHMTSASVWNPSDVAMIQATGQCGSSRPLKRRLASVGILTDRYEYVGATSDDALLDSIDPSLVSVMTSLHKYRRLEQVDSRYEPMDTPARRTFVSSERHSKVTTELIAERFGISPVRAQRTLRVTTQRGIRSAILPISRRYRADRMFAVKRLHGKFATDTAYGKVKSLRGNVRAQLFTHKRGFKVSYPMQKTKT